VAAQQRAVRRSAVAEEGAGVQGLERRYVCNLELACVHAVGLPIVTLNISLGSQGAPSQI
jgi:hypothetical protein